MTIIRFLTVHLRRAARRRGCARGQPSLGARVPSLHPRRVAGRTPAASSSRPPAVGGRGGAGCVEVLPAENAGALGLALRMCSEWSLGCWRKPQQTNVQGRVHRSGGMLAELANEIQGEFQRKHRLVRCWTSDQVLCSLFGSPEWVS